MKNYNQVYGKFTQGTGSWLSDKLFLIGMKNPYDKKVIDSYISVVAGDLSKLDINSINGMHVMDVGSGRQTLALNKLGAKFVTHYDISKSNIKNFKTYLKKNNIKKIKSKHIDICKKNFNQGDKYDLVYLQGIIQHVKNPKQAIINIASSCKYKSKIWFYYYQVGSIHQLYAEMYRSILKDKINPLIIRDILHLMGISIKDTNILIDDISCSYRHLISSDYYDGLFNELGFTKIFKKDVIDHSKGINLRITQAACIAGFEKNKQNINIFPKYSQPKKIDLFDYKNYIREQHSLIKKLRSIQIKIDNILNKNKFSDIELILIAMPIIKNSLKVRISDPFIDLKESIIISFEKSYSIAKKIIQQ